MCCHRRRAVVDHLEAGGESQEASAKKEKAGSPPLTEQPKRQWPGLADERAWRREIRVELRAEAVDMDRKEKERLELDDFAM